MGRESRNNHSIAFRLNPLLILAGYGAMMRKINIMKRQPYNGWFNRATWNVALWIGNDEGLYRSAIDMAKAIKGRIGSTDAFQICLELFPSGQTPDGDKLSQVHWPEIARDLQEMKH